MKRTSRKNKVTKGNLSRGSRKYRSITARRMCHICGTNKYVMVKKKRCRKCGRKK